jgi:signal recognition particle subunit SRP54
MAFESLSERLGKVFRNLRGRGKLSEKDVKEAMREVKTALIEADVNYKITKDFVAKVTARAVGANITDSLTPGQQVIDIVHEELINLLGNPDEFHKEYIADTDKDILSQISDAAQTAAANIAEGKKAEVPIAMRLNIPSKPPFVIMMCGLQGSGKTTHAAKLARYLKSMSRRVLLVACDIYRPAAIDQLKVVGAKVGAKVFEMGNTPPPVIAENAIKHAKDYGFDTVIIDTAGRLHIDEQLMGELTEIKRVVPPHEILLVVDSMTGQDATTVAKTFNETLDITGVILTKLDGDTRGGAAISIYGVTGKPIKFVGTGEKPDDPDTLEPFYPDRMAGRILGMGDILSLIEKAKDNVSEKEQERAIKKMMDNNFDLDDLLTQLTQIEKMGNLFNLMKMIPGVAGKVKEEDIDQTRIPKTKALINSMTAQERAKPSLIDFKRKRRIAKGSGLKVEDVNNLLKQFEQMSGMMKQMGGFFGGKGKKKHGRVPGNLLGE